ncbi:uncharacterized protein MONOS_11804 [Monocercomonoides exilis]|uniref:uncharacterized protein n=1 Tax=Monocercomonoides exilis TaxID=2049356 RepID=UPI00355A9AEA|nr:hypothetical protein MONOS_11804 [Monocercomonoides exilis]|eukprot:MONOS_11804.1-p1 / transcript=MONOS_11804.1 / gene=MONOS_11804 / organism=Monocercomonoides_exilis_PA203 / gene_product=unspecified product / transcript_product=unspecified product / location=Mono_scaffold00613:18349-19310(+) / protein_length=282 / sequence_SO=supercontig / SO=protein_coding / is_pseudo=false
MLLMKANKGSFTEVTNDSHTKYTSLPTLALFSENTTFAMEKEVDDTSESSLYSIMRAPPFPPELVSSLTQQLEKAVSLTENVLSEADEANEMHPPLVALARERERAGEVAEESAQLAGVAVEVMSVMLEELRVRGAVREVRWKMLWLLRVRLVIAVWLRAREPAVRKKRGVVIDDEDGVVPVMVVVLKVAVGSGEEDVDNDGKDENDDVDCDDWECEFCGWRMPLEAMVVAVVPFPVIFVFGARNVRVFVGAKMETRREREASLKGATHPRAYSTVAHGVC